MQEEQIPAAFFGSLNQKAVYSGMSSLAFFVDVLLFDRQTGPHCSQGSRNSRLQIKRNRCHPGAESIRAWSAA
jgi:hypothetical protein